MTLLPVTSFESRTGRGVEGVVDGHHVAVGNVALLRETREKALAVIIWTGSTGWSGYPEPVRHFIEELAAVLAKARTI